MSKANNFDLLCAQGVFRLNRDGDDPQIPPPRSKQPHAIMRRRGGELTRVTPLPRAEPSPKKR